MKSFIIYCAALCLATFSFAQKNIVMGQEAIDDSRYEGKQKDPYLFQEFASAKATNSKKGETVEYLINYNGYSKEFEFIHEGVKSAMDADYYDVIELTDYTPSEHYPSKFASANIKFMKGLNPKKPKSFSLVVYEDDNLVLFKDFVVTISEKEFNDPARGMVNIETFNPRFSYYLQVGGETRSVGLNKKKVLAALNNGKVESYVKKNKIKLKNEAELVKLVGYYAELTAAGSTSVAAND